MQPRTVTSTTPPVAPVAVEGTTPPVKPNRSPSLEGAMGKVFGKDTLNLSKQDSNTPTKTLGMGDPDTDHYDEIAVNFQHMNVSRGDKSDGLSGIQLSRGTDIWLPNDMVRMSLEGNGELMGSGHSLAVTGGIGLKASVGSTMNVFGFGLPFGVFVKGGPALNVTNVQGSTSMGIGAEMAAGVNILGLDVEMVKHMATNVDETGFRVGVNVKF